MSAMARVSAVRRSTARWSPFGAASPNGMSPSRGSLTQTIERGLKPSVRALALSALAVTSGTAQTPDPHAYFESLRARPEMIYAYSMRSQAELDDQVHGRGRSFSITYDPSADIHPERQDAAKIIVPANKGSIPKQVRFFAEVSDGAILFTWDAYWTSDYLNTGSLLRHKTFMVASPFDKSSRWINHMTRYNLGRRSEIGRADYVISSRRYGPRAREGPEEVLMPKQADFFIRARTWTRFWTLVEFIPNGFDRLSYWVADPTRGPVQIYDQVEVESAGSINGFWLEYNSSQKRTGPPLVAYARNLVVLRNVRNPAGLMQRP